MGNLVTIKVQSLTDLITNSSSELFQLRTNETVEHVSEVLSQITSGYCPPVLFLYKDYKENKDKYEEFVDNLDDCETDEEWEERFAKEESFRKAYSKLFIYNVVKGWFFDKDNPEQVLDVYENYLCADRYDLKAMDKLQKEFQVFVLQNDYVDEDQRRHPLSPYRVHKEAFTKFMETHTMPPVEEILDWSIYYGNVEDLDGCILVLSEDDNSIPYETWDKINSTFNGTNYHLG